MAPLFLILLFRAYGIVLGLFGTDWLNEDETDWLNNNEERICILRFCIVLISSIGVSLEFLLFSVFIYNTSTMNLHDISMLQGSFISVYNLIQSNESGISSLGGSNS